MKKQDGLGARAQRGTESGWRDTVRALLEEIGPFATLDDAVTAIRELSGEELPDDPELLELIEEELG